jgi:hypothetical protein
MMTGQRIYAIVVALAAAVPAVVVTRQTPSPWQVPRTPEGRPVLEGVWASDSATPLERPAALADRATLTDEEVAAMQAYAAQYEGAGGDALFGDAVFLRALEALKRPVDRTATARPRFWSYDQQWMVTRWFDNRTSLIIDPPDGRLPPRAAGAEERAKRQQAARAAAAAGGFETAIEEAARLDPGVLCRGASLSWPAAATTATIRSSSRRTSSRSRSRCTTRRG